LSTYSDTLVVGDPRAPAIAMRLEDILKNYPMTYDRLTAALAKRYSDFMVNAKYHTLRRALEAERNLRHIKRFHICSIQKHWPLISAESLIDP